MTLDVGEATGAAYGGRSADWLVQRNRYRDWPIRVNRVELRIPNIHRGS